jgi:hypothetical protein
LTNEEGGYESRTESESARFHNQILQLTNMGETVLGGWQDYVALAGIDVWRGGVHLHGQATWRLE